MQETQYSFAHFETFCIAQYAQGVRVFKELLDNYIDQHPTFKKPLSDNFSANTDDFVALGKRLAMPRYTRRILQQTFEDFDRADHHRDGPAPSWRAAVEDGLQDPKDHSR